MVWYGLFATAKAGALTRNRDYRVQGIVFNAHALSVSERVPICTWY